MAVDATMDIASPAERRPVNPWLIAPVVALAAFMEVLDISIANVALPHIAGSLSASQDRSAWVLTSYLVTNAVVMPISGWLSLVLGRKRFFMMCIVGFTVTSLLCGLAPSLGLLIVLRAIQGAVGGGLQPSGQAILSDTFPPHQRGMAFAMYGMATVFAPAIGPTLGGWLTDNFSWHWVFLINVPVGIVLMLLIQALITDPPRLVEARKVRLREGLSVDYLGFSLVALSLGCFQIVLDRGQQDDWLSSTFITVLSITAAVSFVALLIWELRCRQPIINLRLFKDRTFATACLLMLMLGFILLGTTFLIPAFVQSLMGYTATDAGLVITPGGFAIILIMPFVGRIVGKVDPRLLIAVGLIITSTALLHMTNFYLDVSYEVVMMARVWQALGFAFLFIPINTIAFSNLPIEATSDASALINLMRNFGGSIGISVASTLLTRRAQYHQDVLTDHAANGNPAFAHYLDKLTTLMPGGPGFTPASQALATMYANLQQQATLLAYVEDFKLFGVIFLACVPIVLFIKPVKNAIAPVGAH